MGETDQPLHGLLGNRYRLYDRLGAGGMGAVYRAEDRLTGETVAVKRLLVAPLTGHAAPALRLSLAHEFQTLAGLRHPQIVAVQDYGFDRTGQPYFTMELLPRAIPFIQASPYQTLAAKLDLILQLLAALVYIHRRRLVHRDLKPGNVLVVGHTVKVLDFGLSVAAEETDHSAGTLAYMAPEVLQGAPATPLSDLYAVGVLAYELLAGWHPFANTTSDLRAAILHQAPDFAFVEVEPAVAAVVERLLAKAPAARYPDAMTALSALAAAGGHPLPPETAAVRESFLATAPLVGREQAVDTLTRALHTARQGHGSTWLIGGESGIGKSRLLREVRIRALVEGFLVLSGQINPEYSEPYALWRASIRHLLLLAAPTDLEAAIVQPLVPDLASLLQRPIAPAPVVDAQTAQTRLESTMATLLRRGAGQQPLVLLLEDLHWADENSLGVLRWLSGLAPTVPLLLLATYRDDEAPTLPERIPGVNVLSLPRLAPTQIATLSEAMLGDSGRRPELVTFLQQETEGNTFFMVEAIRLLAEEAGRLAQLGQMTLPRQIFGGGIQQVVERRLQRVPASDFPLLQLAAVAGRQLDLRLLHHLAPQFDIEQWLTNGVNAAVFSRDDVALSWQFSHDKIRTGLLLHVEAGQRQAQHQQIGEALEQLYAQQLEPQYAALAHHFGQAQLPHKERQYLRLAAVNAQATYANSAALAAYERLLAVSADPHEQLFALQQSGAILRLIGRWAEAEAQFQRAQALALTLGDQRAQASLLRAIGSLLSSRSDQQGALTWLAAARQAWTALAEPSEVSATLNEMGVAYHQLGEYSQATAALEQSYALAQQSDDTEHMATAKHTLGRVAQDQGHYVAAQSYFTEALALLRTADDKPKLAATLNNLGNLARMQGHYPQAADLYAECLAIRQAIGDKHGLASVLNNLGILAQNREDFDMATQLYTQSMQLRQELGDRQGTATALANLGAIAYIRTDYAAAERLFHEALTLYRTVGHKLGLALTLYNIGEAALAQSHYTAAHQHYQESLQLLRGIGDKQHIAFALIGLAAVALYADAACERAIRLASAAHHLLVTNRVVMDSTTQAAYDRLLQTARDRLDAPLFTQAWQAGQQLTLDTVLDDALRIAA